MSKMQIIITPNLAEKSVEISVNGDGCDATETVYLTALAGLIEGQLQSNSDIAKAISGRLIKIAEEAKTEDEDEDEDEENE